MSPRAQIAAVLALLWCASALAAGGNWGTDFDAIRRSAAAVRSVQAEFVQTKEMSILARPLVSRGRFAFAAPDSVRWEYREPIRSLLLIEGQSLSRYLWRDGAFVADAAERVEMMRVVAEEIQLWVTGRFADSPAFSAALLPGVPVRVALLPKEPALAALLQRIVLTLDERPGVLRSVEIVESEQARTRIEFQAVRLDEPVAPETFRRP